MTDKQVGQSVGSRQRKTEMHNNDVCFVSKVN